MSNSGTDIVKSTKPYLFPLSGLQAEERLGYLNYVIPKCYDNIRRLEDMMLEAKQQVRQFENERKELINGIECT